MIAIADNYILCTFVCNYGYNLFYGLGLKSSIVVDATLLDELLTLGQYDAVLPTLATDKQRESCTCELPTTAILCLLLTADDKRATHDSRLG